MENEIIKLEPNNYDTVLKELTTIYSDTKERILMVLEELAMLMPQKSLITSVLLVDLVKTNKEFKNDITPILQNWLTKYIEEEREEDIICLLRILWILEYFQFLKEGEIDKLISQFKEPKLVHVIKECKMIEEYKTIIWEKLEEGEDFILNIEIPISEEIKKRLSIKLESLEKIENLTNTNNGDVYLAKQIFNNFMFDPQECCAYTLKYFNKNDFNDVISGLFLYLEEQETYTAMEISYIIKISKHENFLKQFYEKIKIDFKDKKLINFINEALAWIYEQYYNGFIKPINCEVYQPENNIEEIETFKSLLNEDIVNKMIKYSDCDELIKFLPSKLRPFIRAPNNYQEDENSNLLKESYKKGTIDNLRNINKEIFFRSFLIISSPSISHFLTYLETFKSLFILKEEEQFKFCEILKEFVENKPVYKEIITKKLLLFKIINKEVSLKHPELFQ